MELSSYSSNPWVVRHHPPQSVSVKKTFSFFFFFSSPGVTTVTQLQPALRTCQSRRTRRRFLLLTPRAASSPGGGGARRVYRQSQQQPTSIPAALPFKEIASFVVPAGAFLAITFGTVAQPPFPSFQVILEMKRKKKMSLIAMSAFEIIIGLGHV